VFSRPVCLKKNDLLQILLDFESQEILFSLNGKIISVLKKALGWYDKLQFAIRMDSNVKVSIKYHPGNLSFPKEYANRFQGTAHKAFKTQRRKDLNQKNCCIS
jgi:hypothetical protein